MTSQHESESRRRLSKGKAGISRMWQTLAFKHTVVHLKLWPTTDRPLHFIDSISSTPFHPLYFIDSISSTPFHRLHFIDSISSTPFHQLHFIDSISSTSFHRRVLSKILVIFWSMLLVLFRYTQTMHIKSIVHNSVAMNSLKTLAGFEPGSCAPKEDSMSIAPCRQGTTF
jgi:hypothetical protein